MLCLMTVVLVVCVTFMYFFMNSADYVVCFIFFFKQKTAYEMRISDWSSDVCSSDLRRWFHKRTRKPKKYCVPLRDTSAMLSYPPLYMMSLVPVTLSACSFSWTLSVRLYCADKLT